MSERDTHFQNAAKLLYEQLAQHSKREFGEQIDTVRFMREQRTIIAQFAYDLVYHLLKTADTSTFAGIYGHYDGPPDEVVRELISRLPDLTEWPSPSPPAETEHEP